MGDTVNSLKWTPSRNVMNDDEKESEFKVIGHGVTSKLYKQCVKQKKSMIVICEYSEDADNTKESELYLQNVVKLIDAINANDDKLGNIKKWKHPHSLSFANGGKLPNGIY